MAYGDFDLAKVKQEFGLSLGETENLFHGVQESEPSVLLRTLLEENINLAIAINSEKAKSEFLIAPILAEVRRKLNYQISLFSGKEFTIEPSRGLNGFCDFILSASQEQYLINAPVLIIIEAKNDNIIAGLGQCVAAMVAAQIFNQQREQPREQIYGAVTNGTNWKFLLLSGSSLKIDTVEYYINQIAKILGILLQPFQDSLN